jgi:hypothetical protein
MSLNEKIKRVIIEQCKDSIDELSEVTLEELSDTETLEEAWKVVQETVQQDQNYDQFNPIVQYIISHISDFTESSVDEFVYIDKIAKTSLNTTSILFYNEDSDTCLLYVDQKTDEIYEVDLSILSKIILMNFESILSLEKGEVAIFQKKDINELCLEDKRTYCKVLLANMGLSIKDDIVATQKTFLNVKQLTCNKNYLQYKDSINILNKYNNTSDILWKYLLLYQILENFSYRRSITKNLRDTPSLNIKHLSNVYTSSKGEGVFIKDSIKKFLLNITDNTYFSHEAEDGNIISLELISEGNASNLSKKIKLNNIDINVKNIAEFLNIELKEITSKKVLGQEIGEIIYVIRNCIVHNKETEWIHINNSLLQEKTDLKKFFEKFILPTMELLVKELIFKENTIVDYPADKPNYILIWGEQPHIQGDQYHEITIPSSLPSTERNRTTIFHRFKSKLSECRKLVSSWWQ